MTATATLPSEASPSFTESSATIIPIQAGPFSLAVASSVLRSVRDSKRHDVLRSLPGDAAMVVRTAEGTFAAIDLRRWLDVPGQADRQSLVLLRHGGDRTIGLLVDSADRPRRLEPCDRHDVPDWIQRRLRIGAHHFLLQTDPDGRRSIRLLIDHTSVGSAKTVDASGDRPDPAGRRWESSASQPSPFGTSGPDAITDRAGGRGLLSFLPRETSPLATPGKLAMPMACVLHVGSPTQVFGVPSADPDLMGVTCWQDRVVPVVRIGGRLGLIGHDDDATDEANAATRMVIAHTPARRTFAFLTHASMRSMRTPESTQTIRPAGIDARLLWGVYETAAGPLIVPHLDRMLLPPVDPTAHLPLNPSLPSGITS